MTIGVVWVRRGVDSKELWSISDSRLTGTSDGYIWDSCAKLSTMARRDVTMGFAGDTDEAFPLMTHIANAVASYRALADGTVEFFHLIGHLELVVNDMMNALTIDSAVKTELPWKTAFSTGSDTIVLAGYSRHADDFVIRQLRFQPNIQAWVFGRPTPSSMSPGKPFLIFGDNPSKALLRTAIHRRMEAQREQVGAPFRDLDMEPFAALCEMLALPPSAAHVIDGHLSVPEGFRPRTIGGAPQAVRILPGAAATPMVVRWSSSSSVRDYLYGRPLLPYEHADLPLLTYENGSSRIDAPSQWPARDPDFSENVAALTEPPPATNPAGPEPEEHGPIAREMPPPQFM
jgi:hypothetical protein